MLSRLQQFICRFHKLILILTGFLTLTAIGFASRLRLDFNLLTLLPSDNPEVSTFFEVTREIGLQSLLIVLVKMPPGLDRQRAESVVDRLAENFSGSRLISDVRYKGNMDISPAFFQEFVKYLPLFLKDDEIKALAAKLSDQGVQRQVRENKRLMMMPFGMPVREIICADPLGLRDIFIAGAGLPGGTTPTGAFQGYFRSKKDGIYFLFLTPRRPPQDVIFSRKLMAEVGRLADQSLRDFSKDHENFPGKIRVSYTGGYPIAVSDEATTKGDIKATLLTSFLGIMIFFGLSFRDLKILVYVGLTLALGLVWTLGFAGLAYHHLNILTCIFSCVLLGLGIDFAIHILNRYFSRRNTVMDVETRLANTLDEVGMGIIIGAVTTSAAFYSIGLSDFGGFRELGFLTGTGILFCLVVMVIVLPSLLVWSSGRKTHGLGGKIRIAGFGLRTLLRCIQRRPRICVMISLILACFLGVAGTRIHFDDNLKNLRPPDNKAFMLQDKVAAWMGGSTDKILLVASDRTEAGVMEACASIYKGLEELRGEGRIGWVNSLSRYLAAPSRQRKNLEFIRQHSEVFNVKRIRKTFDIALRKNGFRDLKVYDQYFTTLSKVFSSNRILSPGSLKNTPMYSLFKPFIYQGDGRFRAVTYISPRGNLWSRSDTTAFRKMIARRLAEEGVAKNRYSLTGASILTGDLKGVIINNMELSLWLAGLVIVLVLLGYYRSVKYCVLSSLPLLLALISLCGIMVILKINFNFFNMIVLTMIVGVGIDDGVHLTNTFRQAGSEDILEKIADTGRAVVLTSVTTLIGFGSIALSHYPGLRSMGYVAVIGLTLCLLASIIVLPAIFWTIRGRN